MYRCSLSPWKHPHVHGEDQNSVSAQCRIMETPPRAWGRLKRTYPRTAQHRNTPTCMGKTLSLSCSRLTIEETPPRAWGRRWDKNPNIANFRNTPTCMGKTVKWQWMTAGDEKHPHVHGEDIIMARSSENPWETPPRAWGRPIQPSF